MACLQFPVAKAGSRADLWGMKTSRTKPANTPGQPAPRRRSHKATKPRLLTRETLDQRTSAYKFFDRLIESIETDLGGHNQLSTIQCCLVEAFAGACVSMQNFNAQLALGQPIDLSEHALTISAMVRVASRLGLTRVAKDVTLTLHRYLNSEAAE
jgi:hypothetical protein